MPIVKPTPNAPPPLKPSPVQIAKDDYKGVVVDTSYVPATDLLTSIEGSSWTVDYYSQVVNDDNDLSGQQVNREAIYQQYRLIHHLEIKVTTPLTHQQDQQSKQSHVTGTALVYPCGLRPQEGDMFLADIDDGREAVLQVTNSERRTYMVDSVYQIDYVIIDYATDLRRGDLNRKTIQEFYFERDFLLHGQNPLLLKQDYEDVQILTAKYFEMLNVYFAMFASNEYKTLVMPGQSWPVYDHYLMQAIQAAFTTTDSYLLRECRVLNCDDNDTLKGFTLWNAILQQDKNLLPFINRRVGLLSTRLFTNQPMLEGIRYSGVQYVVYPKDDEISVNYEIRRPSVKPSGLALRPVPSRPGTLQQLVPQTVLEKLPFGNAPLIKDVLVDDYYILSQAFYDNDEGQSKLEILVRHYLERKALDRRALTVLTQTYQSFGGLERFYYIPLICMLIRAAVHSI